MNKERLKGIDNPVFDYLDNGTQNNNKVLSNARISIATTQDIKDDLQNIARSKKTSLNNLINEVLDEYIQTDENQRLIKKINAIDEI